MMINDNTGTYVPIPKITYKLIIVNIIKLIFIFLIFIINNGNKIDNILPTTLADKNQPTEPSLLCQ